MLLCGISAKASKDSQQDGELAFSFLRWWVAERLWRL